MEHQLGNLYAVLNALRLEALPKTANETRNVLIAELNALVPEDCKHHLFKEAH